MNTEWFLLSEIPRAVRFIQKAERECLGLGGEGTWGGGV